MRRVHLFTFFQLLSILGLFAVKYSKAISMTFPLMVVYSFLQWYKKFSARYHGYSSHGIVKENFYQRGTSIAGRSSSITT